MGHVQKMNMPPRARGGGVGVGRNSPPGSSVRWDFPDEQGSRCWTRNDAFRANQTYCQKPLRAAHKAPPHTGAAGARARSGPGRPPARPARRFARSLCRCLTAELPKEGPFDGIRRLIVLPRPLASKQKGGELRRWRVAREKKTDTNIFTAAASDFTAERCLQLTAPFFRPPFNPFASLVVYIRPRIYFPLNGSVEYIYLNFIYF
jgi:hypothetical protein